MSRLSYTRTPRFDGAGSPAHRYGAIDTTDNYSDEEDHVGDEYEPPEPPAKARATPNRRWSVLEKLDKQYSSRDRTCCGLFRNITKKCVFATVMLTSFIILAWYFTRTLLFNIEINPQLYDFIVVGGGPAGSVVTRRLLDEGASVLLLEAGEHTQYVTDDNDHSAYTTAADLNLATDSSISEFDIPLLWSSINQVTQVHWGRFNALNINPFKGLGGGGMHSAMLYLRAISSDITGWNVPGWDWSDMQVAYQNLEQFQTYEASAMESNATDDTSPGAVTYRGKDGLFPTVASGCTDSLAKSFINASLSAGLGYNSGFNSAQQRTGVGCYEVNIENGLRVTAPKTLLHTYLQSRIKNKRLTLRTKAFVRRVLLTKELSSGLSINIMLGEHKSKKAAAADAPVYRAVGVEYEMDGELRYAYLSDGPTRGRGADARDFNSLRCVVLSAGAVMTPKLLMNSGVGPAAQLREAGIEVKVDSARVGEGLRDHIAVGMTFQVASNVASDFGNAYSFPQQWSAYTKAVHRALKADSLLSSAGGSSGGSGGGRYGRYTQQAPRYDGSIQDKSGSEVPAALSKGGLAEEFGILGTNGISAGGFLVSPYAVNQSVADIQLTLYPAVTEPHYVALRESKARHSSANKNSNNNNAEQPAAVDFRNQILITATLLSPEATFQVVLNVTHAQIGNPSVHPVHNSDSSGSNVLSLSSTPAATSGTPTSINAHNHAKHRAPGDASTPPDGPDATGADVNRDVNERLFNNNIVPAAVSELDVRRLAWAVKKVREIMSNMVVQGTVGEEVAPGAWLQEVNVGAGQLPSSGGSVVEDGLQSWVRNNAFMQSNWVGTAAMGSSAVPSPLAPPSSAPIPATSTEKSPHKQKHPAGSNAGDASSSAAPAEDASTPGTKRKGGSFRPTSTDNDKGNGYGSGSSGSGVNDDGDDVMIDDAADTLGAMSVVDEELRVRNVISLRVADASVIPALPSGNVHATVLAVAWRAVDFILRL